MKRQAILNGQKVRLPAFPANTHPDFMEGCPEEFGEVEGGIDKVGPNGEEGYLPESRSFVVRVSGPEVGTPVDPDGLREVYFDVVELVNV